MAYDSLKPADTQFISAGPKDIRDNFEAVKTEQIVDAGKLKGLIPGNAAGQIPLNNGTVNVGLNAEKVGGNLPSAFATATHTHPVATQSSAGLESALDKTKLDGIAVGAQVNQNAFSNVSVNGVILQADSPTDTLEVVAGANIALTPDATNDRLTIAVTGKIPSAASADYATIAGSAPANGGTSDYAQYLKLISSNECVLGNGFTGGPLYINYRGTTGAISEYRFCNGMGPTLANIQAAYMYSNGNQVATTDQLPTTLPANGGTATNANYVANDSANMRFHWNGQSGQPNWLWGGNTPGDMYVYNPSNFSVANANTVGGLTSDQIKAQTSFDAGHSFVINGYQKISNGLIFQWGIVTGPKGADVENPFNIVFPIACLYVESEYKINADITPRSPYAWSRTGFCYTYQTITSANGQVKWFAIGY
jgi:hypothetical protein